MKTTRAVEKPWMCQECGRRMTAKAAEKASFGDEGCPGCGGSDIDLAPSASIRIDCARCGWSNPVAEPVQNAEPVCPDCGQTARRTAPAVKGGVGR